MRMGEENAFPNGRNAEKRRGKVKNEWSYTSIPPICLLDVYKENSTLFILFIKIKII
jgi:hypothetical protein